VSFLEVVVKATAYVSAVVLAIGYVLKVLEWGQGPLFFIRTRVDLFWSIAVTTALVALWIWTARLHSRFSKGFADDCKGDPSQKWDFVGSWRVTDENALSITNSDPGGLTKVGALWENYTLSFEAKIIKGYLGVIVRAQDLDNYYMLQIALDRVRPHRRVAIPVVDPVPANKAEGAGEPAIQPVTYTVGWQIFKDLTAPLQHRLDGWFRVRIAVHGQLLRMHINDELVWEQAGFLKIPTGKIGFRSFGSEHALIRKVRLKLDS
jgi:hypothetical protein